MSNKAATISAAVPADVKAEAVAVAAAHGMSLAARVRELVARVAARAPRAMRCWPNPTR